MQILARPLMISSISKLVYNCEVSRSYGMTAKEHFNISSGLGCCFLISYWRYNNIIVQARKSEKSLSKRLVPFSEPEKSLQVLNTAQNQTIRSKEFYSTCTWSTQKDNNWLAVMEQFYRHSRKNYSSSSCLQTVLSLCGRGSKGSLFFPRSRYILHQNDWLKRLYQIKTTYL